MRRKPSLQRSGGRFLALLVLAAYAFSGFLLETVHRDEEVSCSGSLPVLANHACQGREQHIPVDQLHPCLACVQASQRISVPACTAWTLSRIQPLAPVLPEPVIVHRSLTPSLFPSKRGPPAA